MIINNQKNEVLEVVGEQTAHTATIDTANIRKLSYILTEGLYKDAASAIIVELANNGVDAIVESGKDPLENPVIVTLSSENREYKLSIQDNGIGMSKEFFEHTFMNLLESTKEQNNNAIGCYGIGGKSWASLKRTVTFTIIQNGRKCKYLCYKGEELIDFDLILEEDTTDENGVLFEMPINDWSEYNDFKAKARQKLAYYDTVVLIIDEQIWENKIYRNDVFQYTLNPPFRELHLCLKDVVYDIDFNKLGISPIHLPVAIRFGLTDGITPTPSRESIMYGKDTVELLKIKIKEVAEYFAVKYNESVATPVKLFDFYDKIGNSSKYVELVEKTFDVNSLTDYATFNEFKIEDMNILPPRFYKSRMHNLLEVFSMKAEYNHRGTWKTKNLYGHNLNYNFAQKEKIILVDELRGNVKEFLKEKVGRSHTFVGISTHKKSLSWYRTNVVFAHTKDKWRDVIKEWQAVQNQIVRDFCIDYRGIEKTQEFIDWEIARKEWMKANRETSTYKGVTLNKQEGDVTIAFSRAALIGRDHVFEKKAIPIKDVGKMKHQIVVFSPEQVEQAKEFAAICVKQKAAIVGVREFSKIKHFKQIIRWEKFMEDNKALRRLATAALAQKLLSRYNEIIGLKNPIITNCVKALKADTEKLQQYVSENYFNLENKLGTAIQETAANLNLYDGEIMPILRSVEKGMETFTFLSYLEKPRYWDTQRQEELTKFIYQMLLFRKKYYKELENYELVYVPPVVEEEVLETVLETV